MKIDMPPGLLALRARMQPQNRKPGLRVTNAAGSPAARVADVWLYDEIGPWGITAQDFVLALADVTAPHIVLHVSSPGGDVFDGVAIYHALRNHPSTVDVRVEGLAASAASFIAMAGDTVTVEPAAQVMIHDASGLCWGDATEMSTMAALLDRISNTIAGIYAAKSGGSVEEWRTAMRAESWYSASEAVAAGLADTIGGEPGAGGAEQIVPGEDAEDDDEAMAAKASFDLSAFKFPGRDAAPAPKLPTAQAEESAPVHAFGDGGLAPEAAMALVEAVETPVEPAETPPDAEPTETPEAAPEAVTEPVETPSRTDAAGAESPATDEDTWGALVARLTTTIAPLDPVGDALASLREAMQ